MHDNVDDKYYDKGYREAGYGRRTKPHNSIITGEGYHLRVVYQAEGARGSRYAFLRTGVEDGFITGDTADAVMNYMKAIEEAVKITDDINARYDAFANAEASLINNALVVPMGMSIPAYIATRLNYWEGQYASTGFSNKRLKGIHVLDHYISMSEYEANRDAR